jgi:TolA-binding protein
MELLRQNMERQLVDENRRIDALEQENRVLKQERTRDQTNVQSTTYLNNNNVNPANVGSSHDGDDVNAHNDINYGTELDNTEESDDDDTVDDISYDTPSEDEEK